MAQWGRADLQPRVPMADDIAGQVENVNRRARLARNPSHPHVISRIHRDYKDVIDRWGTITTEICSRCGGSAGWSGPRFPECELVAARDAVAIPDLVARTKEVVT